MFSVWYVLGETGYLARTVSVRGRSSVLWLEKPGEEREWPDESDSF